MDGKPDTGSVNSTCASGAMPQVNGPMKDTGSPPNRPTGPSIPGVSGDSSGKISGDGEAPDVAPCRDSPNPSEANNPQQAASGPERMPITR